jgi:hypothetical protein
MLYCELGGLEKKTKQRCHPPVTTQTASRRCGNVANAQTVPFKYGIYREERLTVSVPDQTPARRNALQWRRSRKGNFGYHLPELYLI